jgi:inactivated superfamily I helicase
LEFCAQTRADASDLLGGRDQAGHPYGAPLQALLLKRDLELFVRGGDPDRLKVFANEDAAETSLQENDPEGVVFEYEGLE